jgi:ribonuclease III
VRVEHGLTPEPEPVSPLSSSDHSRSRSPASRRRLSASIGHLSLFNQYLQQKNKVVEWVYKDSAGQGTRTTPVWVVRAMVNEECIGRGRGNTKKAARNEAAKEGLQSMGVYVP